MVVSCSLRSDKILMSWNFQLYLDYHQIQMSNLSHNMFLEFSKLESFTNYYNWKVRVKQDRESLGHGSFIKCSKWSQTTTFTT
jgi:hypothetical protein